MTSPDQYLDELLHDAWIPLPPVQIDDAVVLQCHRDADKRRSYFRVTLTGCGVAGFDDPESRDGMKVLGVAVSNGLLCIEGVEGAELRLALPVAIKHAVVGSVDDTRSWTSKIGIRSGDEPPKATAMVPVEEAQAASLHVEDAADEPSRNLGGQATS